MKKVIAILVLTVFSMSCSKSSADETVSNTMAKKLIGSWKLVGYYDDIDNDPITGTNYHLVQNGDVYKYNLDETFDNVGDQINPDGTYSVALDSVFIRNFNANSLNPNMTFNDKISKLTSNELEFHCNQTNGICDTYRYEKVITP